MSRELTSRDHYAGLDLLRFVAASGVMLFHFTVLAWAMPESTAYRISGGHVAFPELAPWISVGWIGVQVFFVISGFVIAFSTEGATFASFLRSRALRLLPAAWICATVTWLALGGSLGDYARSMTLSPWGPWVDPVYWTLGIELSFYGLVALLIAAGGNHRLHWLAIVIGGVSAVYWVAFWLALDSSVPSAWGRWLLEHQEDRRLQLLLIPHGCFFALGVYVWHYFRRAGGAAVATICLLLAMVCVLQIVAHNTLAVNKTHIQSQAEYAVGAWAAAIVAMIAMVGWRGAKVGQRMQALLRRIGLMTYPLYLVHQVLGCLLLGVLASLGASRWIAFAASVLIVLTLSLIISTGIEPALRRGLARAIDATAAMVRVTRRPSPISETAP